MTRNITIAQESGSDGVFLINHRISALNLIQIYTQVRKQFPDFFIGINILNLTPIDTCEMMPQVDGLWVDDAGIKNSGSCFEAEVFKDIFLVPERSWLCFGGVAFKGQELIDDVEQAARNAIPFMDVIATSGDETGMPPTLEKIQLMRKGSDGHALFIASGMTPYNVYPFLPYIDGILASTGVSSSFTEFDPELVPLLINTIHQYPHEL